MLGFLQPSNAEEPILFFYKGDPAAFTHGFQPLFPLCLDYQSCLKTAIQFCFLGYHFSHNPQRADALSLVRVLLQREYPCPGHAGCPAAPPQGHPGTRTHPVARHRDTGALRNPVPAASRQAASWRPVRTTCTAVLRAGAAQRPLSVSSRTTGGKRAVSSGRLLKLEANTAPGTARAEAAPQHLSQVPAWAASGRALPGRGGT